MQASGLWQAGDVYKRQVYAYSDSPNFEILLFAYAFDEEPTQITDLACGENLPQRVLVALEDPAITKAAFNAQFERTCISRYLGRKLSPEGWQCTAVQSAMLALPLSLDNVGEVLNIPVSYTHLLLVQFIQLLP